MTAIAPYRRNTTAAWALRGVLLTVLLSAAGCAQISALKSRAAQSNHSSSSQPSTTHGTPLAAAETSDQSLSSIINDDLQNGRYAEGHQALDQYLQRHPGDHAAQSMLRQLTGDPVQMLGAASHPHVVQPGESFSTLAARYLGDANQFLILARYNNASNPSLLRVGATLKLPASASSASNAAATNAPADATVSHVDGSSSSNGAAPEAKARQLQAESISLMAHGQKAQALARLDAALTLDPTLKSSGPDEASLRAQLVNNYHQQAIVLYRDQQLDRAIALWDRVLTIDPDYEPAKVYRARAMELKQRLQQY